jgi:hypothetical protein
LLADRDPDDRLAVVAFAVAHEKIAPCLAIAILLEESGPAEAIELVEGLNDSVALR